MLANEFSEISSGAHATARSLTVLPGLMLRRVRMFAFASALESRTHLCVQDSRRSMSWTSHANFPDLLSEQHSPPRVAIHDNDKPGSLIDTHGRAACARDSGAFAGLASAAVRGFGPGRRLLGPRRQRY